MKLPEMKLPEMKLPEPVCQPVSEAVFNPAARGRARHVPRRMRGWISVEWAMGIALFGLMLIAVGPRITDLFSGSRVQLATVEINDLIVAAEKFRSIHGTYAPTSPGTITVRLLADNGYGMSKFKTGGIDPANGNVYGQSIAIASASSGTDATVSYVFGDGDSCDQVEDLFNSNNRMKSVTACTTAHLLALTIE